jgi:glycosyltransferase involved in cell wall biosynthesis
MKEQLRILMVLHMPWTRNLGAPRVQYEIAEEFREMGHIVEKFDLNDAFPKRNKVSSFFEQGLFVRKAAEFIRQHGHKYDIIDAHQANLPFSKSYLNFQGLLAARSCGLGHFFLEYKEKEKRQQRLQGRKSGTFLGNVLRSFAGCLEPTLSDYEKSFQYADVINVLNRDEYEYVSDVLGFKAKVVLFPHGLRDSSFQLFEKNRQPFINRYQRQEIVFVGNWSKRKGSSDFPKIIENICRIKPLTKFLFLGTGCDREKLCSFFSDSFHENIQVVPTYTQENLPSLISGSTLAVFPSYCEGFPWSVLEKLAAGLPVVAYDIPGVRDMLSKFSNSMLVKPGEINDFSEKIVEVLNLPFDQYCALAEEALMISEGFKGRAIAHELMDVYQDRIKSA